MSAVDAKTGTPVPGPDKRGSGFEAQVADNFPDKHTNLRSPGDLQEYCDHRVPGAEIPSKVPRRCAWVGCPDRQTAGRLYAGRPELNHDVWQEDQWQGRSGLNTWGIITVDTKNGIVFLPVGTPTTDFYGAEYRSDLYGSSVVALDAGRRNGTFRPFTPRQPGIMTTRRRR